MDNETLTSQIIDETYQITTQAYIIVASLALLAYASLLHFTDELEYIWKSKFTLPTYLYFLSKYPVFLYFLLAVTLDFLPNESLRTGNTTMQRTIVWGIWKLKRSLASQRQSNELEDLVTILLRQDLRRRNVSASNQPESALYLPSMSFREGPVHSVRTVLARFHEIILVEMGERNDLLSGDDDGLIYE
ncbi:hypothetical protein Clacol_001186 [Clathrus columnatus]|uniref:DUF6533 domain-containing protein n=1 Tax=Clathrus columnatus TaxID=1419009 RepID=A0AAV5A2Y2_9AGAM|nr:hypothetical protein Clacol_001186 [Clathrus columnatus]